MLTLSESERYARHLSLKEVGLEGQLKLKAAKVLLVGVGGLGSPAALYLAASGVGTLGIVEHDVIDRSNLQRQVLYVEQDAGRPKIAAATARLQGLNSDIEIVTHEERLRSRNALEIFTDYDIVLDGSDNFATRYLVNDAAVLSGIPNVFGSIDKFHGQVTVFGGEDGPCYRCLYPEPPDPASVPSCSEAGVLGVLPGVIGTLQATEVIKLILGVGEPLVARLLSYDALNMSFREIRVPRNEQCPVCGTDPKINALIDYDLFCDPFASKIRTVSPAEYIATRDQLVLLDVRESHEYRDQNIGGQLIPLGELQSRLGEISPSQDIVILCKSGKRAKAGAEILTRSGYTKVRYIEGGLDALRAIASK